MTDSSTSQVQRLNEHPIAIIGISALFPQAEDLSRYWSNILDQIDSIIEIPESRWKIEDYFDSTRDTPDKTYSKRGGFLPDIDFNPMDFGIPPNILEVTDSSQLLSLLTAKSAMEDSGYGEATDELLDRTGVILGVTAGMKLMGSLTARLQYPIWERVLRRSGFSDSEIRTLVERLKKAYVRWEENSFPGLLGNVIAGRIANRLNLGGTNCTVDAACASSLSAMKMAISDLVEHRADMMISGGVDADNSPFMYMCFSKTPAFTPDDAVKPFDAESRGIMIGEGLGMVILKRLEDAERDGDKIYAVIKGIGTSSDGRFKSIYAPRPSGQAKALRRAYEDAGFSPDTVGLIEAHGTGTTAGDLAEFEGLTEVFKENNPHKQHIALGTVKSQIGHTKAAAGVAGLIKAALALYQKILPPTINIENPNPKLKIEETPFYLNTETRPWFRSEVPRRAGISSFGFGGTNYHFVLEEYHAAPSHAHRIQNTPQLLILAADNPKQLTADCREHLRKLDEETGAEHLRYLLNQTWENELLTENARLGFVCESLPEAREQLRLALSTFEEKKASSEWSYKGIFFAAKGRQVDGTLVALFSGQGSQYLNMGRELLFNFPPMFDSFQALDKRFREESVEPLSSVLFPLPVFENSKRKEQESTLQQTQHAQPAIGGISAGMFRVLKECGLKPNFTAGHSFGELTALWAAGVFGEEDFYRLAHARGQAMAAPDDPDFDAGSMLAVMGKVDQLEHELKDLPEVKLANLNSKKQVVLAGPKAEIEKAREQLKAKKFTVLPLPVSAAFHTPLVEHAKKPFAEAIRSVTFHKPAVKVYSNASAQAYPSGPKQIKKQLEEHILQSVRFREEIERIHQDGGRIFIEFGPKNILTKLVDNILAGEDYLAVAMNESPNKNSDHQFREAVLRLCVAGLPLQKFDPFGRLQKETGGHKSPLSISLNGANYVSDATLKAFDEAFKDGPVVHSIPAGTSGGNDAAYRPPVDKPLAGAASAEASSPALTSAPPKQSISAPMTSDKKTEFPWPPEQARSSMDQNLEGYFQQQQETLKVHRQYLEQQSEYSRTVLQLMQQQLNMVAQGVVIPENVDRHLEMFHKHQAQTLLIHKQYLLQQTEKSQSALQITHSQLSKPQLQSAVAPGPAPSAPNQSAPGPTEAVAAPSPAPITSAFTRMTEATGLPLEKMSRMVFGIVSDKTGYPAEMLEMSMDMEADLGIDSIKRVEILGSLQDQLPDLPEIRGEDLAELRTLGQILDYLKSVTSVSKAPAEFDSTKPAIHPASDKDAAPVEQSIYRIVSEKTGYPVEMLDLTMDMESDLGIDSIKRVEILGSLQDSLPGLPEIRGEELAELRSLGQIVSHLQELIQKTSKTISPASISGPQAVAANNETTTSTSSFSDASKELLSVISIKTGYPAEMLEMSMDMEADLGIDSIKRVEIMWALQERFPELPQLSGSELGELHTLQQILEFMHQLLEGSGNEHLSAILESESSPPAAERLTGGNGNGSSPQPSGIAATLLAVIGEKTGYPPAMLEMSMDLEADLGIDSIKRVEIMWAFQEKYPNLPQVSGAEMGELRTLQQIADYLNSLLMNGYSSLPGPNEIEADETQVVEKKNL